MEGIGAWCTVGRASCRGPRVKREERGEVEGEEGDEGVASAGDEGPGWVSGSMQGKAMTLLVAFHVGASIACNCNYNTVTKLAERIGGMSM